MRASEFLKSIIKPYVIVFRHVLSKPHTIKYPYERLKFFEGYRGRISLALDKCIGCGLCSRTCPNMAIEMVMIKGKKHRFPQIDFGKCSFCGFCIEICPRGSLLSDEIVELSVMDRKSLIYTPQKLSEPKSLEEILEDLKKIMLIRIQKKIVYVIEREVKK